MKNNLENDKKLMKSALSGREKGYAETGHQWYFMDDPLEQRIRTPTAEYMQISRYSISLHYALFFLLHFPILRQTIDCHPFFMDIQSHSTHLRFIVCLIDLGIL